ncbi:hypothetical protein Ahu01nite_090720 [Winogradskya humida]|uniref:Uncharacterized protein n=1 Tax=Winogradskya humida TaxID=113566 RepID=A0ABQ4A554_9ACTN|nr:hypothetical protein Ahu01nite_090720 [Actinoplanes humidus]
MPVVLRLARSTAPWVTIYDESCNVVYKLNAAPDGVEGYVAATANREEMKSDATVHESWTHPGLTGMSARPILTSNNRPLRSRTCPASHSSHSLQASALSWASG